MKKMLVLLAATLLTAGAASAQTATVRPPRAGQAANRTPEQQADRLAQRLTKALNLTSEQATQVRQIGLDRATEGQALRGKYAAAGSRQGLGQDMQALRDKYDAQLKAVLSADQYAKYDQLRDDQLDKRKDKVQNGKLKVKS